jgi:adenylate cyclase class 2
MPIELEIKLRVADHDAVRQALEARGARFVSSVAETNTILDDAAGRLRQRGEGLRVRVNQTVRGDEQPATLTFKGPRQPSAMKRREERETAIADPDATLAILKSLGFAPVIEYEKKRESWIVDDCRVELDYVERLGSFVEIEGPSEQAIEAVRAAIGLSDAKSVSKSYVRMVAELGG